MWLILLQWLETFWQVKCSGGRLGAHQLKDSMFRLLPPPPPLLPRPDIEYSPQITSWSMRGVNVK
jgi:hypothetical protein